MRPSCIVLFPPGLDLEPCIGEREEPVLVQALISELAVETLDVAVLYRVTRPNE